MFEGEVTLSLAYSIQFGDGGVDDCENREEAIERAKEGFLAVLAGLSDNDLLRAIEVVDVDEKPAGLEGFGAFHDRVNVDGVEE